MPGWITSLISNYGYLAIFFLIFIQEIGFPNPLPNEVLLLFSGFLSFKGTFILPLVILSALAADFTGTCLLYLIFYFTGNLIVSKKPLGFRFPEKLMTRISDKIESHGMLGILVFRLTPFTRGYTSAITGLLRIKPGKFLPIAFLSGLLWSSLYILAGYLAGPSWEIITSKTGILKYILDCILIFGITIFLFISFKARRISPGNKRN